MILLDQNNNKIYAQKCTKPSFKDINGRTWDHGFIKIDDHKVQVHLDTTWGEYIYFQLIDHHNGKDIVEVATPENDFGCQWYKLKMISDSIDDLKRGYSYDVDPFATEPQRLTTK